MPAVGTLGETTLVFAAPVPDHALRTHEEPSLSGLFLLSSVLEECLRGPFGAHVELDMRSKLTDLRSAL